MSPRFRLRDLVLVASILVVLFGLLLLSARSLHRTAKRVACENNLWQLNGAIQAYHNSVGYFPTEVPNQQNGSSGSLYFDIGTFIQVCDRDSAFSEEIAIREYLCPARRGAEAGARTDYGYGASSEYGISILDAQIPRTRGQINNADGTAYTLLLSHKGVCPRHYDGSGPNDPWWHSKNTPSRRDSRSLNRDADELDMWQLLGSPHEDGVPSLFADGHIEVLPYVGSDVLINNVPVMAARWAYNDGNR